MRARIAKYRRADPDDRSDFPIGCRILTQPFFLDEPDWIENGRHYYALHGQRISAPQDASQRSDPDALTWHNEHCFRG